VPGRPRVYCRTCGGQGHSKPREPLAPLAHWSPFRIALARLGLGGLIALLLVLILGFASGLL